MGVHQEPLGLDFTDPRPLGREHVIECVAGLGQPVSGPLLIDQHLQLRRRAVPARGEDSLPHVPATVHLDVRVPLDDLPCRTVEHRQPSILLVRREIAVVIGVVRHEDLVVDGVSGFEMGIGVGRNVQLVEQVEECRDLERFEVRFQQQPLHRQVQRLPLRLRCMDHRRRETMLDKPLDRGHFSRHIDDVRPDQELVCRPVHHPVGIGPDDALLVLFDAHTVVDREQAGPRARARRMRHIGHHP